MVHTSMSPLKKLWFTAVLLTVAVSPLHAFAPAAEWQKITDLPVSSSETRFALSHPLFEGLLLASKNRVFQKESSGRWKEIWRLPGVNNEIKKIVSFPQIPGKTFAITREGIYLGDLSSGKWQCVFTGSGPSKEVLSFAVLPEDSEQWFAGTSSGIFETDDAGKTWNKIGHAPNISVTALIFSREHLYAAFGNQIYVSENLESFKPVFGLPSINSESDETEDRDETIDFSESETRTPGTLFTDMTADEISGTVWASSEKGVFETRDQGNRWEPLPSSGLRSIRIRSLLLGNCEDCFFAASQKDVYRYNPAKKYWSLCGKGMSSGAVYSLALSRDKNEVLALTSAGVLKLPAFEFSEAPLQIMIPREDLKTKSLFNRWISLEPSARSVQKDVARYGNLKNAKINRWQAGSRLAALLPSLSFGKDFSSANNVDLDRGSTSDRDTFIIGPDDTNRGWDFDVSWDLGDFIYSSAQTSIDGREKLMVELRHEMLTEATRLYYERRRLQMEFITSPPQNEEEHLDLIMRIDELTALLDGMTDGRFGKKLEKMEAQHPELSGIWEWQENS